MAPTEPDAVPPVAFILICQPYTQNVPELVRQYSDLVAPYGSAGELVIVANGLATSTLAQVRQIASGSQQSVAVVELRRPCEHSTSLRLALRQTNSEQIVILSATSQSQPSDVQHVLDALRSLDYVGSVRRRRGVSRFRRLRTKLYNRLIKLISGVELHDINSGLCGFRRRAISEMPLYGDMQLFMPVLAARQGFRVGEVEISPPPEHFSHGPFQLRNYLRRGLDLFTLFFLTGFTEKPFRLFGSIGAALATLGAVLMSVLIAQRVAGQPLGDRPLLALAVLLIVMGIQLLSLGLLGELIIFVNAGATKTYYVDSASEDCQPLGGEDA